MCINIQCLAFKAAMVVSFWPIDIYFGSIDPTRWECLKALTPEQVEQNIVKRIPNAAKPKVSLKK